MALSGLNTAAETRGRLRSGDDPYGPPGSALDSRPIVTLFDAAIGPKNTEFYLRYMIGGAHEKTWAPSWNWPAFLITGGWLLYRKCWLGWFGYTFALPALLTLVSVIFAMSDAAALVVNVALLLLYLVVVPTFGNAVYAAKVRSLVGKAEHRFDDEESQVAWLRQQGGTSIVGIVFVLAPVALALAAIATAP